MLAFEEVSPGHRVILLYAEAATVGYPRRLTRQRVAEHRLLANYAKGARPANNYAFAPALCQTTGEILDAFRELGFISGSGPAITYPGPGEIDASNVIETTPGGAAVTCAAPGTSPDPRDPVDPKDGCQYFKETDHNVCGTFRDYWNRNGGLAVFGYPLTEPFHERNFDTDETYTTQCFERQRFEPGCVQGAPAPPRR